METLEKLTDKTEHLNHPLSPLELQNKYPLSPEALVSIDQNRREIEDILYGDDDRKIVIVGPCSLDDQSDDKGVPLIYHFADKVKSLNQDKGVSQHLKLVLRTPPAKPRTDLGWVGLENTNLEKSYELMSELVNGGLAVSMELMHEKHFARYGKLLSLGWVGARNVEDTMLRHAVSAHDEIPVLFKNSPSGQIKPAANAMLTAKNAHKADIIDENNQLVEVNSRGNYRTGVLLRGGDSVVNPIDFENKIDEASSMSVPFLIDCAHGNARAHDSGNKSAEGQLKAFAHLDSILSEGSISGFKGIMLEAHLKRGLSKTDDCMSADEMEQLVQEFAQTLSR